MSESETARRITAVRLVRRIPDLLNKLESGALMLSTLVRLEKHITSENAEELVEAVRGLTQIQVAELLAKRAPRPDVPGTLRKLPEARLPIPQSAGLFDTKSSAQIEQRAAVEPSVPPMTPSPTPIPTVAEAPKRDRARFEPLSEARYRLQLTASLARRDKLEHAKALMRHRNPSGDLAVVVEAAMDVLVAALEKERLGRLSGRKPTAAKAPSMSRPAVDAGRAAPIAAGAAVVTEPASASAAIVAEPASASAAVVPETACASAAIAAESASASAAIVAEPACASAAVAAETACASAVVVAEPPSASAAIVAEPASASAPAARRSSRYIPRATRRAVFERDGARCAYVSADGERCASREFLEIHHVHAHARGGSNEIDNLQVACRAHNGLHAEEGRARTPFADTPPHSPTPHFANRTATAPPQ